MSEETTNKRKIIAPVSAYGEAIANGYTGTKQEFGTYLANAAEKAEETVENALVAEGYATGKQNGVPVGNGSQYSENNAEFFAGQAKQSADDAEGSKNAIEGMTAVAVTLSARSAATVTKTVDPQTGAVTLSFGIPKGEDGNDGGSTSVLIAASNSTQALKDKADFVCTGINDQVVINNAMSGMTNGEICILAGDYYVSGPILPVSNVDIKGFGNPQLHLTDRIITTLSQAASINDETIYLTDPSDFVVGQKIAIIYNNQCDYEVGSIKTIDYETGAVTMYAKGISNYSPETSIGKVSIAVPAGATVFTDSCVIMGWNKENVMISGLFIDGNKENLAGYTSDTDWGSNLIEWSGGNNVKILKNKLTNCYKHSVLFVYGTKNSFVCENIIDKAITHGIDFYINVESNLIFGNILNEANIQCHGGLKTVIANNILTKCQICHTGAKYNIVIGNRIDNTDLTTGRCMSFSGSGTQGGLVSGNVCIGANQGIQLDSSKNIKLAGNKFINQRQNGIHLYKTTDCIVDNNDVYFSNQVSNGEAIRIENASTKNIISGNTIHGTSGKTTTGINEAGNSADYNAIVNNVIYDATTGITKTGTNSIEQNNVVFV